MTSLSCGRYKTDEAESARHEEATDHPRRDDLGLAAEGRGRSVGPRFLFFGAQRAAFLLYRRGSSYPSRGGGR